MNREEFLAELKKINIIPTAEQLEKLDIYANFLIEYNKHTNLTRIIDLKDIYLKHFYDSLTIVKEIDLNQVNNLLDIGSGAGFPGMVLKIFFPNINITLLDSNNKKTTFLKELATKLNVDKLEVIHSRVEEFATNHLAHYDLVTSRAVANLITLSELSIPLVKINGNFIALKGDLEKEEDASYAIDFLGGKILNINKFLLPNELSVRNIINIKKIKTTPKNYPRVYDKILKKPLKKVSK